MSWRKHVEHAEVVLEKDMSGTSKKRSDDTVAEGVWLTADTMAMLIRNAGRSSVMNETLWQCNQMRAGQLYTRTLFDTRMEAEQFVRKMREAEPDQMFAIERVEAAQVWN
jgi:hypothetical protein